jgi:hypothetical protein
VILKTEKEIGRERRKIERDRRKAERKIERRSRTVSEGEKGERHTHTHTE